jgi:hypothetical protein
VANEVQPVAPVATHERCPVLTRIPVGLLAVIGALVVILAIVAASSLTASGSHSKDSATGVVWANW